MKFAYRRFKCLNCGHVQEIQTNHEGECIDYCKNCSWKPSFGEFKIPFNGRTYRPFRFDPAQISDDGGQDKRREGHDAPTPRPLPRARGGASLFAASHYTLAKHIRQKETTNENNSRFEGFRHRFFQQEKESIL